MIENYGDFRFWDFGKIYFGNLGFWEVEAWLRLKDIPPIDIMEKQYCKRCNATKPVEEFNGKNKYCIRCLEKNREKHQRNKEQRNARNKQYREEHKEEISAKKKEWQKVYNEVDCEICKCKIKKCWMSRHLKTLKHIENEKRKETPIIFEEKPVDIETI